MLGAKLTSSVPTWLVIKSHIIWHQVVVVQVHSIAASVLTLTSGYSRREAHFCVYVCELPVSKEYTEICSINIDAKLNLGSIGELCPS